MLVSSHKQRTHVPDHILTRTSYGKLSTLSFYKSHKGLRELHRIAGLNALSSSCLSHNPQRHFSEQSDLPRETILEFGRLLNDGIFVPNGYTFPFLFKACRKLSAVREGRQLHAQAIKRGFNSDAFVQSALIRMYAKCRECEDAFRICVRCCQPDIVSQNDLIAGCVKVGELELAHEVFSEMVEKNVVSWSAMLDGYARNGQIELAHRLFDEMPVRNQFSWNSLISGYMRCGHVKEAEVLFDQMPEQDVVAWTVMISGYTQNCWFKEGLECFLRMQKSGVDPNRITLISVLPAIAHLGALTQGRWVHAYSKRKGMELEGALGASLVDMYSKCGCIEEARSLFEELKHKELSAWNSMISGLGAHGLGHDALQLFSIMLQTSSVAPNEITFAGVLCACSHAGLVDEGRKVFDLLSSCYKLVPNVKHYGCMVDLLGRAGLLQEAKEIIEKMPIEPNTVIWKTLLGACRTHKNVELADYISKIATQKGDQDSGFYSLLSNVYTEAGRRDDAGKVRTAMNDLEVCKVAGCSWIEVDGVVHEFFMSGERFHSQEKEILFMVKEMGRLVQIERGGMHLVKEEKRFGNCYSSIGWMVT